MANTQKILSTLSNQKFDRSRAKKFDLSRAKGSLASRSIPERISNVDVEARTADFSFASNKPIEHWFGYLILDTTDKAVILDRVTNGVCPHLVNHDTDKQVGVVLADSITLGDMVRGTIKFSRSAMGEEVFCDVQDEIRNGVSFGFLVHDMVLESEKDDVPTYRATKWEILETTSASIPADISVGIGRELYYSSDTEETANDTPTEILNNQPPAQTERNKENTMEPDEIQDGAPNAPANPPAVNANENRAAAVPSQAILVAREINELGEMLGESALAREYVASGQTVAEFRAAVKAKTPPATQIPATKPENVQLARTAYRGTLKSFRGDRAAENAYRFGQFLRAVIDGSNDAREFCKTNGIVVKRAQSESDNESGGFLVPHEFENVMIDLRLEYGVFRRNANVVPMASESKSRPRRKGGLKAYPIGARGASRRLIESKKNWDAVDLLAKKWGVLAKYEEELAEDAVISIADDLASEISYAFTQVEDEAGFYGDGTSEYHGITGVIPKLLSLSNNVSQIAGLQVASGNQWSEITQNDLLGLIGRLPSFARNSGQVKFYCTNEFWSTVFGRIGLTAGGITLADFQGKMTPQFFGTPVEIVEAMPHTEANSQVPLLYGNLAQAAMFGDRRGVTIKTTDSNDTDFEEDLMAIKGTERFDINVHDVGNADADPKKRLAGPIVGLITAAA